MNKTKVNIIILIISTVFIVYAKEYIPPLPNEDVYVTGRIESISSNDHIVWDDLIARSKNSQRLLVSIPLGANGGLSGNETWLTRKYLYFYLLGNEQLNNKIIKKFAQRNNVKNKLFGEGEEGRESQQDYIITHGMDLFRFNLQTGEFFNTGFTLHSMDFAVSPDDRRICVRTEKFGNEPEKLSMYDLNDGTCINDNLLKEHPEIGTIGAFRFHERYFFKSVKTEYAFTGIPPQTWPDLIWDLNVDPILWEGKINWNTCTVEVYGFSMETWKPNYYVLDGPLNIRSDPGLQEEKMFQYQLVTGTKVLVTETGKTETIDGITAPWVWIWGDGGNTYGWVFSGYLKKIQ